MEPQQNNVSKLLRGALKNRADKYKERLVKSGCMEPAEAAPAKMAAAILKARKSNKKKK